MRQTVAIVIPVAALAAMVAMNVLRPDPMPAAEQDFLDSVRPGEARSIGPAERAELRRQWERFSPESRKRIFFEIARDRLEEFRAQTAELTPEQRAERITKAVTDLRRARHDMSPAQKARVRERLSRDEGKEMVRNVMDFFQSELTARERADLDPLVHEWLYQMERVMRQ